MPSLLKFERAKFGVLCVEITAAKKEVPTSTLEEAWTSLEVTKTVPAKSLVEVKAAFKELYSDYFAKEGTPAQGSQIYAWDAWSLLVGWDEILQQVKDILNCEIEALRAQEEKSIEIIARWRDDNKVLSNKIASLEAKLQKAFSQEEFLTWISSIPTTWIPPSGHPRVTVLPSVKVISITPSPPNAPPVQNFSLADQFVPHTGIWRPLATAVNYLVRIAPIVYMVFQAQLASPMGVQPNSGMCHENMDCKIKDQGLELGTMESTNPVNLI
ncbi:hypothetical protein DSO57_1036612 [Entomophthora muscae]|uniref:Uncharacterized protein n=1 Tax=Entomophthora muscae TaxID=34485 RepID=A0ACC2RDW0_9FUNG|nr:hypothetical protein DSO57_1036612 [Entomophthora muscae]